jgi:putative glutamine amidotransferase
MRLELETRRFYLGRDYSEALDAAGGLPVHIPLIPDPGYVREVVKGLDGVLLPGSDSDVDPAYFGEDPHPKLKKVVPEKDSTEMLVLSEAEKQKLPVFAICYGMQALNVSRGGSLIQDIDSQVVNSVKHEQGAPLDRNSHRVRIADSGILSALAGSEEVKVNSHHHQAIRSVGSNLVATAWAGDGVIECIEDSRVDHFALGVQWHPELSWRSDELSASMFKRFVSECVGRNGN